MTQSIENWMKSPWTISIGTAIFTFLLPMGYDFFMKKPIYTTIWEFLKRTVSFVWSILNFDLKIWWMLVVAILLLFIIFLFKRFKKEESNSPDFYDYREDVLKKWKWTWGWQWSDIKKAWIISNLKAHCPKCDTPMIQHQDILYGSLSFNCPRCDFRASNGECEEPHKIERIILDNIDRKRKAASSI